LRQLVLARVLIGHSPYRAVVELLRDLFDWKLSLGTVHNIVHGAVEPARAISRGPMWVSWQHTLNNSESDFHSVAINRVKDELKNNHFLCQRTLFISLATHDPTFSVQCWMFGVPPH